MENILYISVAAIAIAFIYLVAVTVRTLKEMQKTLFKASNTLDDLEKHLEPVLESSKKLIDNSNELVTMVKTKAESLDGFFEAVYELKHEVMNVNRVIKNFTGKVTSKIDESSNMLTNIVQNGNIAVDLYNRWKTRKKKKGENSQDA
jgi:uncharacterized protein YoxC